MLSSTGLSHQESLWEFDQDMTVCLQQKLFLSLYLLFFYFILKHSLLTMLCEFQVYSKMFQLYIYVSSLFKIIFSFRLLQNNKQSSLCYPVKSMLVIYFKYSSAYRLIPNP